jgi:hypothetical protein
MPQHKVRNRLSVYEYANLDCLPVSRIFFPLDSQEEKKAQRIVGREQHYVLHVPSVSLLEPRIPRTFVIVNLISRIHNMYIPSVSTRSSCQIASSISETVTGHENFPLTQRGTCTKLRTPSLQTTHHLSFNENEEDKEIILTSRSACFPLLLSSNNL